MAEEVISRADARAKGLNRYFTGTQCPRGHVSERYTNDKSCIRCREENNWTEDPQKRRGYSLKWIKNNREICREKSRAYRSANPDKVKESSRLYRNKNSERLRESVRRSNARRDPEAYRLYMQKWRAKNRAKVNANGIVYFRARRARKIGATGSHAISDLAEILKLQKNKCAYCRVKFGKIKPTLDHIIALSRGGSEDRKNLQFLCKSCNSRKQAQDPLDFARKAGMLL